MLGNLSYQSSTEKEQNFSILHLDFYDPVLVLISISSSMHKFDWESVLLAGKRKEVEKLFLLDFYSTQAESNKLGR